jgi:hypothetical protein
MSIPGVIVVEPTDESGRPTEQGERVTVDPTKRDWLFPAILGALLTLSVVSFALAFVERVVPHQELKISADHERAPALGAPTTDRLHRTDVK